MTGCKLPHRNFRLLFGLLALAACKGGTDMDDTGTNAVDADNDGIAEDLDCDDQDATMGAITEDADCDGSLTADDCDDNTDTIYPGAPEIWDDGIDQDCDGVPDVAGATCSADLLVTLPNGNTTALDGCANWNFEPSFEYTTDSPPKLIDFTLNLGATADADLQCKIRLNQKGICGPGYYDHRSPTGQTEMVLVDCSNTGAGPEDAIFTSEGYLRIDTIDAGETTGDFANQALSTTLEGHLHVWTASGINLEGDLAISLEQIAGEAGTQPACADVSPDEDTDGRADTNFDGDDCDDADMYTYPGSAEQEPTLCTPDADDDGYGDSAALSPVDAGTDCDDSDAALNPADNDQDGFSSCNGDCDDNNYAANFSAVDGLMVDLDCIDGIENNSLFLAEYSFTGIDSGDESGTSVSTAGDVDGDGLDDLIISAPGNEDNGYAAGKAYLILSANMGSPAPSVLPKPTMAFSARATMKTIMACLSPLQATWTATDSTTSSLDPRATRTADPAPARFTSCSAPA